VHTHALRGTPTHPGPQSAPARDSLCTFCAGIMAECPCNVTPAIQPAAPAGGRRRRGSWCKEVVHLIMIEVYV
jgi:hypothetical protein